MHFLSRYFSEAFLNYFHSVFVLKNLHDHPQFCQLTLFSLLFKKYKIIFLLLVLVFIFFSKQLPYFNLRVSLIQLFLKRVRNFYLFQTSLNGSSLNFNYFYDLYFLKLLPGNFNGQLIKILPIYGASSLNFLFNTSKHFSFFSFFNLPRIIKKFPECYFFFQYCNFFLKFHFKVKKKRIIINYYNVLFFLAFLKVPYKL